jgi:hypothetical protein
MQYVITQEIFFCRIIFCFQRMLKVEKNCHDEICRRFRQLTVAETKKCITVVISGVSKRTDTKEDTQFRVIMEHEKIFFCV